MLMVLFDGSEKIWNTCHKSTKNNKGLSCHIMQFRAYVKTTSHTFNHFLRPFWSSEYSLKEKAILIAVFLFFCNIDCCFSFFCNVVQLKAKSNGWEHKISKSLQTQVTEEEICKIACNPLRLCEDLICQ